MDKDFYQPKDIIAGVLKKFGIDKETFAIFEIWEKELGKMSKNIRLVGRKGSGLLVEIEKPAYRQEFNFRKAEFIKKINGHFGKDIIKDIKIVRN